MVQNVLDVDRKFQTQESSPFTQYKSLLLNSTGLKEFNTLVLNFQEGKAIFFLTLNNCWFIGYLFYTFKMIYIYKIKFKHYEWLSMGLWKQWKRLKLKILFLSPPVPFCHVKLCYRSQTSSVVVNILGLFPYEFMFHHIKMCSRNKQQSLKRNEWLSWMEVYFCIALLLAVYKL